MQIWITFFFGFQLFILQCETMSYFERKSDPTRSRTLLHAIIHLAFNSVWILTITGCFNGIIIQGSLFLMAIITATYSFYYWQAEFQLENNRKKSIGLFSHLIFASFIYSILQQLSLNEWHWLYFALYAYVQLTVLFFIGGFLIKLTSLDEKPPILGNTIYLVSVIGCILPIVVFFSNSFLLDYILFNSIFLLIALAYRINHVQQMRLEESETKDLLEIIASYEKESDQMSAQFEEQKLKILLLRGKLDTIKNNDESKRTLEQVFTSYGLTPREKEVAVLLLQGKSNQEIANMEGANVQEVTIRTHGMNIYMKLGITGSKKDKQFRKKFGHYLQ